LSVRPESDDVEPDAEADRETGRFNVRDGCAAARLDHWLASLHGRPNEAHPRNAFRGRENQEEVTVAGARLDLAPNPIFRP